MFPLTLGMSKHNLIGKPIASFDIIVPRNYEHDTVVEKFFESNKISEKFGITRVEEEFHNDEVERLVPGNRYIIKFFKIPNRRIKALDCMRFVKSQNGVPAGIQGMLLAYQLEPAWFPLGGIVSLCGESGHPLPVIYNYRSRGRGLDLLTPPQVILDGFSLMLFLSTK